MARKPAPKKPVHFRNAGKFRAWLEMHAASETELLVGFHKVATGKPSLTWPESVDEALCFGWIDGIRKSLGDHAYQIRFSPRKKDSVWSAVNIAKVEALRKAGRMTEAGLAAYALRTEAKSGIYAYEQAGSLALSAPEERQFRRSKDAWRYFEKLPPGYRRTMLYWVVSAKRPDTRARRLEQFVTACAAGRRLLK